MTQSRIEETATSRLDDKLRSLRDAAGLTVAESAAATGLPPDRLVALEEGRGRPPLFSEIVALAGIYGARLESLDPSTDDDQTTPANRPGAATSAQGVVVASPGLIVPLVDAGKTPAAAPGKARSVASAAHARSLTSAGSSPRPVGPDVELEVRLANRGVAHLIATMLFEHEKRHPKPKRSGPAHRKGTTGIGGPEEATGA